MYIYLTRHGETLWNAEGRTQGIQNISLSERGVRQAEALADRLSKENFSALFSSNLERAYRTAAIIGDKTGRLPEKWDELREINYGDWEGLTLGQIEERYPGQLALRNKDFCFAPEGGECILAVRDRVRRFLDMLDGRDYSRDSGVLVATHANTARLLLIELMGFPLEHLWDFRLDNTGLSILQIDGRRRRIICLNDTCHLHRDQREPKG